MVSEEIAQGLVRKSEEKRAGALDGVDPVDPIVSMALADSATSGCKLVEGAVDTAVPAAEAAAHGAGSVAGEIAESVIDAVSKIFDGL